MELGPRFSGNSSITRLLGEPAGDPIVFIILVYPVIISDWAQQTNYVVVLEYSADVKWLRNF